MPIFNNEEQKLKFMATLIVARIAKRLTQTGLAKQIGSTKNTVWCWEHGVRQPNMTNLKKLEKTLGVKFK